MMQKLLDNPFLLLFIGVASPAAAVPRMGSWHGDLHYSRALDSRTDNSM